MSDVRRSAAALSVCEVAASPSCGFQSNEPPAFVLPPRNVRVSLGGHVRLEGKSGMELQSCGGIGMYELSGRHFLEIKEVQMEDAGSYTCLVTNSSGTATASAELIVQGVPEVSPSVHSCEEQAARNLTDDSIAPDPGRSADQQLGRPGGANLQHSSLMWLEEVLLLLSLSGLFSCKNGGSGRNSISPASLPVQPSIRRDRHSEMEPL